MSWEIKKLSECCASIADGDHQAPPKADSGIQPRQQKHGIGGGNIFFPMIALKIMNLHCGALLFLCTM